jgi:hypothetical protein
MRDVEFQAMVEQAQLPTWREPTDEELHQLFWRDPPDPLALSVTPSLPRAAAREHIAVTAQRADLEYQQRRAAWHLDLVKHGESRRESAQPVSPRIAPPSEKTGYRVQLQSGDAWYDVGGGGGGYHASRESAERWRDALKHAQGHLVLRIVGPTA